MNLRRGYGWMDQRSNKEHCGEDAGAGDLLLREMPAADEQHEDHHPQPGIEPDGGEDAISDVDGEEHGLCSLSQGQSPVGSGLLPEGHVENSPGLRCTHRYPGYGVIQTLGRLKG